MLRLIRGRMYSLAFEEASSSDLEPGSLARVRCSVPLHTEAIHVRREEPRIDGWTLAFSVDADV